MTMSHSLLVLDDELELVVLELLVLEDDVLDLEQLLFLL
jgi:hypothetical protein